MSDSDKVGRNRDGTFGRGNPGGPGRPINPYSLTALLRKHGEDPVDEGRPLTRAEDLSIKLWTWAQEGDKAAAFYIFDRLEGKAKEHVEHSGFMDFCNLTSEERAARIAELVAKRDND